MDNVLFDLMLVIPIVFCAAAISLFIVDPAIVRLLDRITKRGAPRK